MMDAPAPVYDRTTEDVGNIVELGHVNVRVPDQGPATQFYVSALGLTRDPYMMTGTTNMWVNVGRGQFHLPTGGPQVIGGVTGLVLPDTEALLRRLSAARRMLQGTGFAFVERDDAIEATCPWGNRIRCHPPEPRFGAIALGMPYVALDAPPGSAQGIARFYREVLGTPADVAEEAGVATVNIPVGIDQRLLFRETDRPIPSFDGAHIQVSLADFSGPYKRLLAMGLITEESDQHQYRFQAVVDPETRRVLCTVEHEVRSMRHPLYARALVNRNPAQSNVGYAPGHDARAWGLGHG